MGYTLHEAIIVTSWDSAAIVEARAAADALGLPVSDIVNAPLNGFRSFAVLPDGSKEGWDDANDYESRRAALIARLRVIAAYSDGSSPIDFCCVQWGEDEVSTAKSRRELIEAERARGGA